jgi:putative copper export protein/mono/diheme cytochrome c family protein
VSDPLILLRAVHFAATLMLAGALIFGVAVGGPALRKTDDGAGAAFRARLLQIAWLSLAVALVSGVGWLIVLAVRVSERAAGQVLFDGTVWAVLLHTTFGHACLVRLVAAASLTAVLCSISPKYSGVSRWVIAALLASAFTLALVHSGHAAATSGWLGTFHRAADGLHLIAASAWLGGLLPLALLLAAARRGTMSLATAFDVTTRFSALGVISVGILIATGVVNGWILAGSVPALVGTEYGELLLLKVALFLAMVAIAAVNRRCLTPRLARAAAASGTLAKGDGLRALVRNSLTELAFGLVIVGVVGALGTVPPGAHAQPTWPFAVRLSDAAVGDPQLRAGLVLALWSTGGGVLLGLLLAAIGVATPRLRWWLIAIGGGIAVACVAYFAPTLSLLTVPAFPTSFYASPTGYSASSILRGADLFATHCASCHGPQGRGDGPAGRFFRTKPSDLTADHVYAHTDGDLYWWIVNGIGEVMPPFGAVLEEEARWSLIDFVRANADAVRLARAPAKVTNVGFRSPDFSAACPNGSTVSRDGLAGRIAHLVIAGRGTAERLAQLAAGNPGVVTVAIPLEDIATAAACRVDEIELAGALALFRGRAAADSGGTEFLVGGSGELRALWYPGAKPDWRDADVLQREIAAVRDNPVAGRTIGSHPRGH